MGGSFILYQVAANSLMKNRLKILLLFLPLFLYASPIEVGSKIESIKLYSQHDTQHRLVKSGIWVISWDKKNSRVANKYFNSYGMKKNINFIVDVASAPSFFFNIFALPELQEFKHTILLSPNKSYNKNLPYKEGFLTILYIQNKKVTKIEYVKTLKTLHKTH